MCDPENEGNKIVLIVSNYRPVDRL